MAQDSVAANGPYTDVTARLRMLAERAGDSGFDVILVAPGADMRYLIGHSIGSHERFTCLIVPASGPPTLLVPALEWPGWVGTAAEALNIVTWSDGDSPYAAARDSLPPDTRSLGVDAYMPSIHALGMREAVAGAALSLAAQVLADLRMRKSAAEVTELMAIGAANDRVHRAIDQWLRVGRTEDEVATDIASALLVEGHVSADFVIVGSGPNGASPHHEASGRVIEPGDAVVVDIGGPNSAGYFSDCTRTYLMAGGTPDPLFDEVYELVRTAQVAALDAVRPGVTCAAVDEAARSVIDAAGYGEYFITRTGHGIGLEVHEHPYIVSGNAEPLQPGMAFSIEPGVYLPGRFGVRIEDIVVVTDGGSKRCNRTSTDLVTVGA